jgi:hypothetical protein
LPALWLLGSLFGIYAKIAVQLTGAAPAPTDYRRTYDAVFAALEAGRIKAACTALADYFERHDRRLLATLGIRT